MELSQVIEEIKRIPPDRLLEVYRVIHVFRLGLESESASAESRHPEPESSKPRPKAQYNFADLAGQLTWQGDAVCTQRSLRDEW